MYNVNKGKIMSSLESKKLMGLLMAFTLSIVSACKPSPQPMDPETTALVQAKLAKADAVDGQVDQVITKCAGCSLAMDGSPEHTMKLSGFTLHLCSASCKTRFGKDTVKKLLAIEITEP